MILEFKEIPKANTGNGDQDTFELFARDFLEVLGYKIIQNPDRGADGKKDLIVQESRQGPSGTTYIKWLVSCKHYAHSGKSVSDTDELNILDRVSTHQCDGFIGFYSTLPATSLGTNIQGLKTSIETYTLDREQIEKILLENSQGLKLASRYFPKSFSKYVVESPKPAKIFSDKLSLCCEYCGKNLLKEKSGIFVLLKEFSHSEDGTYRRYPYTKAYFSCKGDHDRILKNKYLQDGNFIDEWVEISSFTYPTGYIKKVMSWFNSFQEDSELIEGEAFDKLKILFLNTFPHISREQTTEEKEHIQECLQNGYHNLL